MPRKLSILILAIVGLHIVEVFALGKSATGALFGNLLQTVACFTAAAMCVGASRRGDGFARSFWLLVGAGIGVWGFANLGWTYYEVIQHREPPDLSFVRFLFDAQEAFFAMAILLDQDQDSHQLDFAFVLDATQIVLVCLFIYVGLYYVPSLSLDSHGALVREYTIATAQVLAIFALSLLRTWLTPLKSTRQLYGGLTAYLAVYAAGSGISNYAQAVKEIPTGSSLLDLVWTVPLLCGAAWAATWKPIAEKQGAVALRKKSLGETILTNALFGVAPVLIFLLSTNLGREWRMLRYSLLTVSVVCYVARMAIRDYRQSRNAEKIRQQASALDLAVDGMAIVAADGKYAYVNDGYAQMLGSAGREEMIGKPWQNVSVRGARGGSPDEIKAAIRKNGSWLGIVTVPRGPGESLPVELAVTSLPEGGVVLLARDLRERRKAEHARTEAEMKYQMIVEQVAAISYIAEPGVNGRWYYVSPQIESILGYTPEEWLENSENWLRYVTVPRGPGESLPVELAVTSLPEGGVVLLARDLRERRKAEHARTEAEMKYQMIVEQVAAISYIAEPGV